LRRPCPPSTIPRTLADYRDDLILPIAGIAGFSLPAYDGLP
jgi:hypothetical protein